MQNSHVHLATGDEVAIDLLGSGKDSRSGAVLSFEEGFMIARVDAAIPVNTLVTIKSGALVLLGEVCAARLHEGEFQVQVVVRQFIPQLSVRPGEFARTPVVHAVPGRISAQVAAVGSALASAAPVPTLAGTFMPNRS